MCRAVAAVHDDIGELMHDMGCAANLIEVARRHPNDAGVQAAAAGALRNLAASEGHKQSIADKDGIALLLTASRNHRTNAGVQAQVAGALRNISLNDDIAKQVAAEGGITELIAVSTAHAPNPKVQAGVAGGAHAALPWAVECDPQSPHAHAPSRALAPRPHPMLSRCACACVPPALRNLSVNEEIAGEIVKGGGIDVLVIASQSHPTNADVQAEVAGTLWGLTVGRWAP